MLINGPSPQQLQTISSGAAIATLLPHIQTELNGMKSSVEIRMYSEIATGKLTPDSAYAAWQELYSYHRLLKRLETRVNIGTSTGEEIAPHMELDK